MFAAVLVVCVLAGCASVATQETPTTQDPYADERARIQAQEDVERERAQAEAEFWASEEGQRVVAETMCPQERAAAEQAEETAQLLEDGGNDEYAARVRQSWADTLAYYQCDRFGL